VILLGALLAGLLFGGGLLLSGMANPATVLAFLDVAGKWNPALAFTMAGAILIAAPAFYFVRRSHRSLLGADVHLPNRTLIDSPLVVGSAVFGVGWGLSGICPGPGLLLLATGTHEALAFMVAMGVATLVTRIAIARRRVRA
jgi:uncharacterized membrane protein YedE/YeeE